MLKTVSTQLALASDTLSEILAKDNTSGPYNIAMDSGYGIDFSATAGTGTSELLDDYEEGTWTPTVVGYSGGITASGTYVKVGTNVVAYGTITLDGTADGTQYRISSLPFSAASSFLGGAFIIANDGGVADVLIYMDNGTELKLKNSSGTLLSFNSVGASSTIAFSASYIAT